MAKITQVLQTASFKKTVKKLHANQKADLDIAIKVLMKDPLLGEAKKELTKIEKKNNKQIEPHFFTQKDLNAGRSDPLIKDILRNGKEIL